MKQGQRECQFKVGHILNYFTVMAVNRERNKTGSTRYMLTLRCVCGNQKIKPAGEFTRSNRSGPQSCGCVARKNISEAAFKHGDSNSRTYRSWVSMRRRCSAKKDTSFHRYGARGISVCERWSEYSNFLSDMGERPEGTSLDRIDGSKGYSKDNCRWATAIEQAKNTKKNVWLTHEGRTMCQADWARELGVTPAAVSSGVRLHGSLTNYINNR